MNKLNKWVKAVLASASTTAALSVSIVASPASAFELRSDLNLTTGYRSDTARFAMCATLSNPDFFGYGDQKYRNVNMWTVQLNGVGAFTDNWYLRGFVGYATVLGGRVFDTGVFDILSDPYNATFGQDYYSCCKGCICEDCPPCDCGCDLVYHNTVPAAASVGGDAWDADLAIGYMFHASEEFGIAPVFGWSFNQQRYTWNHSQWGPIPLMYQAIGGCAESDDEANDFYSDHLIMDSGVAVGDSLVFEAGYVGSTGTFVQSVDIENTAGRVSDPGCGAPCVVFGGCGDDNIYRARWNGPFLGLDFVWTPSQDWYVVFGYELHYNHYSGRFDALGGVDCCDSSACGCDYCPSWTALCDEGDLCTTFVPATVTASSNGWGQVFNLDIQYMCNQNWQFGIDLNYTTYNASGCDAMDPCTSCYTVCNGAALVEQDDIDEDVYPVWQNAAFKKARWSSFAAQVSVGYLF
ncbi:MAG: hypothetical protein ACOYKZ_03220 [Chlamydiia bacterium]